MTRSRMALWSAVGSAVPLAIFTIVESRAAGASVLLAFQQQIAVYVRLLICVPLLIVADDMVLPRLWRIADYFATADLVADRVTYNTAVASARRAMEPGRHRILILLTSLIATIAVGLTFPSDRLPVWHAPRANGIPLFSLAGWWHVLVCLPLVFALIARWIWRVIAWGVLLRRISRCGLRLVAAHPDGAAGLAFVGSTVRAFFAVEFAFSAIAAGRSAQLMANGAQIPTQQIHFNAGYGIVLALLFMAPVFTFTPALIRAAVRGKSAYGAFAQRMGGAFEQRWIDDPKRVLTENVFGATDFSATIDMYSIMASARKVRYVPLGRRDMMQLAISLAVPFLPLILIVVPAEVILKQVRSLLF